ncbi:peptide deformylase [Prosthecobacter sp.]|uniref:peptide deformylase n=1 Tax=Prosthecobacter sp. TaxID=1965333 RepID=UPI001DC3FEBA|nr:peptide deformylase [Prosthecobacter sp.]MCB1275648.1 peptide deformylase [Prosthecobacter sp.]
MVRKIVRYPEPVLRAKCRPVTEVTPEIRTLADDMLETMREANGVGLAAPQVAVDVQLAVIDVSHNPDCITFMKIDGENVDMMKNMPVVFLNPKLELGSAKEIGEEGCLSFPRLRGDIRRSSQIKVTYTDLEGKTVTVETDGLLARAFQHEIDHLNGILFIDRLNAVAKVGMKRKLARLMQEWEDDD